MPPVMEAPVRDPEHAEVPSAKDVAELHLLIGEMDDEITGYRRREAVWLSLVVHVVVIVAIILAPKWMPKSAVIVPVSPDLNKDITFQLASPDQQRVKPPNTNIASDKNRIAQSRNPVLNKDALRKILDASRPGPHAPTTPPPAPAQQAMQQQQQSPPQANPQQQVGAQNTPQTPPQPTQSAQLHTPAPGGNPFKTSAPGIQGALDSLSANHGKSRYTFGGDYGAGVQPNTNMRGDVEITTDTMGVDFGPYLQRVLYRIKMNWYNLIPEVARAPIMKKGKLIIAFAIMKDGTVQGMVLQFPSGDVYLDRAAWGGITASDPFGPLPSEFGGNYLGLRIKFIYNSTSDELN